LRIAADRNDAADRRSAGVTHLGAWRKAAGVFEVGAVSRFRAAENSGQREKGHNEQTRRRKNKYTDERALAFGLQ
jgi:hypothetical protein